MASRSSWRRAGVAAVFLLAVAACVPVAYYAMFSQFRGYDDEGYFLVSLKLVGQGQHLYDAVATGYGPTYYLIFVPVFKAIGVSHDAGRLVTIAVWSLGSVVFGDAVRRVTRSLGFGLVSFAAAFFVMAVSVWEPMNPGPILYALVGAMAWLLAVDRGGRNRIRLIGGFAAAAALVKLNVGAYAATAALFALVTTSRPGRRYYRAVAFAALVGLPVALFARDLGSLKIYHYAVLVAVSGVAVAAGAATHVDREPPWPFKAVAAFVLGAGVVAALVSVLTIVAFGSTPAGLFEGVFVRAVKQRELFKGIQEVQWLPLVGALPALALPLLPPARLVPHLIALAQLGGGALIIVLAFTAQLFGQTSFAVVEWGIPFVWLLLATPADRAMNFLPARSFLAALAVLEALYAYPVPGAQRGFAEAFVVPAGAILLGDGYSHFAPYAAAAGASARRMVTVAPALLGLSLLFVTSVAPLQRTRTAYRAGIPVPLHGAHRLHLQRWEVDRLVFLTRGLAHCSTFVPVLGLNSLYLFAEKQPPAFMAVPWTRALDDDRQREIVARLYRDPRACVAFSQEWSTFWDPAPPAGPLLRFVREEFTRKGPARSGESVLVRR